MKKNIIFLFCCLWGTTAGFCLDTDISPKMSDQTFQKEISTLAMDPHLVEARSTPNGAMVYILDLEMGCLPITYEYIASAGGTVMSSGRGESPQGSFYVSCPTPNFTLHVSGSCKDGHSFYETVSLGQAVPNCGLEFTTMSLSSSGGGATLTFEVSSTKMNPSGYAIYQNGIKQSEGTINPSNGSAWIPFGTTTSNIQVRIYGDKCMCANKTDHYVSYNF